MSWNDVQLGNLCDVLDSQRKPITKRDRTAGEYPYYGATGVVDYVGNYIFDEKLVLIGEDGAKWESGERTAFIANGKYWVNNHAHVVKPKRDLLLDEWLVYYFYYKDLQEYVTGLTVPKLNQGQLKLIPIPLPPLATQRKIVAKLDAIFAEIDKATAAAEANAKNAEALFQSYLRRVFKKADGLKIAALGSLCDVKTGKKDVNQGNENGIYPFFTCAAKHTYSDEFSFDCEAILIAGNGAVGQTSYYKGKFEAYQRTYVLCNFVHVIPQYLLYFLNGSLMNELSSKALGNTIPYIKKGMLTEFQIPLPPLATQQMIVAKLDAVSTEIKKFTNSNTDKVSELSTLKQSVLTQAFAGELIRE